MDKGCQAVIAVFHGNYSGRLPKISDNRIRNHEGIVNNTHVYVSHAARTGDIGQNLLDQILTAYAKADFFGSPEVFNRVYESSYSGGNVIFRDEDKGTGMIIRS